MPEGKRKRKFASELRKPALAALLGSLTAFAVSAGLLALLALLAAKAGQQGLLGTSALLALSLLSGLAGGTAAAFFSDSRRLPVALGAVLGWFALWLLLGGVLYGALSPAEGLPRLAAALLGGLLAAYLTARAGR